MTTQEDDEFEEFEQQEWTAAEQDADDTTMWQDGWEDDEEDDQFTKQLRAELAKTDGAALRRCRASVVADNAGAPPRHLCCSPARVNATLSPLHHAFAPVRALSLRASTLAFARALSPLYRSLCVVESTQ